MFFRASLGESRYLYCNGWEIPDLLSKAFTKPEHPAVLVSIIVARKVNVYRALSNQTS